MVILPHESKPSTLALLLCLFGADRIVYASDYPFGGEIGEAYIRDHIFAVRVLGIGQNELGKIFSLNAKQLLKI